MIGVEPIPESFIFSGAELEQGKFSAALKSAKTWSYKLKDTEIFHHISKPFGASSRKRWSWFGGLSEMMEWPQFGLIGDQDQEWFPEPEGGKFCCGMCLGWDIRVLFVPTPAPGDVQGAVPAPLSHPKQNPKIPVTSPGKNTTFHPNSGAWRLPQLGISENFLGISAFCLVSLLSPTLVGFDSGNSEILLRFTAMNLLFSPKFPIKTPTIPVGHGAVRAFCPTQEILWFFGIINKQLKLGRNAMEKKPLHHILSSMGCGSSLFPFHHF